MRDNESSSDIFPPGEPPAAAPPATERDLMRGWPLPWTYDTLNEKVLAADGHEVCDFGSSDRSEQDELAHWVVALANASLHPPASAVQPTTDEQTDYQAALTTLPDTLGRPLARRIEIVLEGLRRESHVGCELRRELDGGIERDAKAIEAQWPDAAKYLRSHAHIEDGV